MDAPNDKMKEGKISKVSEAVSKTVSKTVESFSEAVSTISRKSKQIHPELEEIISGVFSYIRNRAEKKENILNIDEEDYKFFEGRISSIDNKLIVSKRNLLEWAFLVHDWNRQHIFEGYAKEAGFITTPVHGTLIAAHAEQYVLSYLNEINSLIDRLNEKNGLRGEKAIEKLSYSRHKIRFVNPLYLKRRNAKANWNLDSITVKENGLELGFYGTGLKEKEVIVECPKVSFNIERKSDVEMLPFYRDYVRKSYLEIKEGERETFYRCLGKKSGKQVYFMHVSAFSIASLLDLSSERTGRPEGTYASANFEFHNLPNPGIFEVVIKKPQSPREVEDKNGKNWYAYIFKSLCVQKNTPILTGRVVCYSPYKFNFR